MASIKKITETIDILQKYNGTDPYISYLKDEACVKKNIEAIGDFQIEYVALNKDGVPQTINKMTRITDWYAEKLKKKLGTDFLPIKLKILSLIGETSGSYYCSVKYRQSADPVLMFIPKNVVLKNFTLPDYKNYPFDPKHYNDLMHKRDENRNMREHQIEAVKFLLARKKCILALDMGMGKSAALSVAAVEGNFDSVLIICPASLKTNWKKELSWFVPESDISIITSNNEKSKEELEAFLGYGVGKSGKTKTKLLEEAKVKGKWGTNKFVILNYDIISDFYKRPATRSKENIEKAWKESPMLQYVTRGKCCIIIDEAHKLSNSTSNRSKLMKDLIKRGNPDSLYLSTGTPITNNPQNLFCVLSLLDDPITSDYAYYMKRYCGAKRIVTSQDREKRNRIQYNFIRNCGKQNWGQLTNQQKMALDEIIKRQCRTAMVSNDACNLDELRDRISHIYLKRDKEELGTMPEKTIHEVLYELTPTQRNRYEELWDEYEREKLAEDPEKELSRDLLEGGIYRRYLALEMVDNTIKLTEKILHDEPYSKVVIMCCFDNEINALKDYFGERAVMYNGKMNAKQKDRSVDAFQNDENIKIFLGNVISSGVGITLIRGNKLIFNDMDFVPSNNHQCEDRIVRLGQQKPCDIYYQIYKDTQYEHMWDVIMKKSYNIDQVIKKEDDKIIY